MTFDEQYKAGQARFFPDSQLCRFLGRTYGMPWPSCERCDGMIAGDIGCGAGANLRALFEWGFTCYGIDPSKEACQLAYAVMHDNFAWPDGEVRIGNLAAPPLPWNAQELDLIVDCLTTQHMTSNDALETYHEVKRVLKSDGRFFCVRWINGDREAIFPDHPELLDINTLTLEAQLQDVGLKVESLETFEQSYHQRAHVGRWAVVEARA